MGRRSVQSHVTARDYDPLDGLDSLDALGDRSRPVKASAALGFRRIICLSCGERRIVGVACPTCGEDPDPREVDPDRQARRRLARFALEALDADLPSVEAEHLRMTPAVWPRTQAAFEDLLTSLMCRRRLKT
jgi:hypothetical protein